MSIKRILVPIPDRSDPHEEIALALSAATLMEAQVEVLFISEPPPPPPQAVAYSDVIRAGPYAGQPTAAVRAEERERQAQNVRSRFTEACGMAHMPIMEAGAPNETLPSARWREAEGAYSAAAVERAAAFDLVVAASAAVGPELKDIAEATLLQTGRPVLLAPLRQRFGLNEPALVAFDGSPQCWHAITAAVPFLQRAKSVQVVSVGRNGAPGQADHSDVVDYLACHGVTAVGHVVDPGSQSIGATLLAEAGDREAGLLVMGAYAHSRLREMLLGGVTRHVLANTAATPVLMAH